MTLYSSDCLGDRAALTRVEMNWEGPLAQTFAPIDTVEPKVVGEGRNEFGPDLVSEARDQNHHEVGKYLYLIESGGDVKRLHGQGRTHPVLRGARSA